MKKTIDRTALMSAAEALAGHEIDIAHTSRGRAMIVCECGKIILDAQDDEGEMTSAEFDEGWHLGRIHIAEIVLEAALKEKG